MTLCKAYKTINKKGITPWMCYGILKWNKEYIIIETMYIKKYPNKKYIYTRKGEGFPNTPNYKTK